MLEQQIGIKYPVGEERQNYLRNSSDGMETVSYAKPFTPAEMAKQRELLTDASISGMMNGSPDILIPYTTAMKMNSGAASIV